MKTILCYGDSNTWGYIPGSGERYPYDVRWPGVMQGELGKDFMVIEEGCSGRTTVWDDPIEGDKNGKSYLPACLYSHHPIDLVIIMLGTNDLKMRFSLSAYDIAEGIGTLTEMALKSGCGPKRGAPEVLILIPPPVQEVNDFAEMLSGGRQKSLKLPKHIQRLAQELGVDFMDTAEIVEVSQVDGVHFEAPDQTKLGKAVAAKVRAIFKV